MSPTAPLNPPPRETPSVNGLAETMQWMQQWFEFVHSTFVDANSRIDRLVEASGIDKETHDRIGEWQQQIEIRITKLETISATQIRLLEEVMRQVDQRSQLTAAGIDRIERSFGEISARYQQSLNELNRESDERFITTGNELRDAVVEQRKELQTSFLELKKDISQLRQEDVQGKVAVVTARIGREERIAIAAIAMVTAIISSITTYLIAIATRGAP